jgi:membrane fusion protein (multidrug efflux system)
MFARVRLITRDQSDAMVLPEQALVPQGSEQYVFRVIDNKAARVKVETGRRRDAKVEVVSGLKPGDVVVTAGQLKLRDGVPVTVTAAQGMKDAAPQADVPGSVDVGAAGAKPVKAEAQAPRRPNS